MGKIIRLTEQDISNIIDETLSLMCENKGVTFNGEAYPDGGWAVIVPLKRISSLLMVR